MLSTPSSPFSDAYQAQVASGAIEPDAAQAEVAEAYAALDQRLATYKPQRKQGLLSLLVVDGHFAGQYDQAGRHQRFARHASTWVDGDKAVKDGVGYLISDLVRMPLRNGFAGKVVRCVFRGCGHFY